MVRYSEFNENVDYDYIKTMIDRYFSSAPNINSSYEILKDGHVNFKGYWILDKESTLDKIPIKMYVVEGDFFIASQALTTLKDCPKIVTGSFYCSGLKLTNLEGGPISAKNYTCDHCQLTSLIGGPNKIEGSFSCTNNNITSLEGGPDLVGGSYYCRYNKLSNFENGSKTVKGFMLASDNPLTSLNGLSEKVRSLVISYKPDLPLLRLLKVKGDITLRGFNDEANFDRKKELMPIVKKYKGDVSRSNIIAFQRSLIDAGFESNAKW